MALKREQHGGRARAAQGRGRALLLAGFALLLGALWHTPAQAQDADLAAAVAALNDRSFQKKEQAVEALSRIRDPRVAPVLRALLAGDLHYRKADGRIVIAAQGGSGYRLTDAVTGEALGEAGSRETRKIGINNSLRTALRGALARRDLSDDDPAVRLAAVEQIASDIGPETGKLLREALAGETDATVRETLATTIAIVELNADDPETRLAAVASLKGSLNQEARNRLRALVDQGDEAGDAQVRRAAADALESIESRLATYRFVETAFFGLSLGSVLVLAAIGLAITFGVMGVINMAHGELIMLGAYTTYLVQQAMPQALEWSLLVAVPAAFLVSAAAGIAIERGVIRFLYGRPLETLLATFGISLVLQQLVRTVISPQNVPVANPDWMAGSLQVNSVLSLTYNRLYILAFSLIVFALLLMVLKKTSLGLQVRAVAQNRAMARAMGIRSGWVDAMTFGLGAGIAGVAGVALSQLTNVGPNLGQAYIIDSFMVVVFGGVGNLWGTLVGGLTLGVANKFLEPWSGAVLAKILVLVFIIVFIQKRPRGLFPQRGRAAEA